MTSCATCRFWKPDVWSREKRYTEEEGETRHGEPLEGWCRRFPPNPDYMPSEMPFPMTAAATWCGEYALDAAQSDGGSDVA